MTCHILPLPGWREPLDVLPAFADEPMPALLHSRAAPASSPEAGRWSFLCASPFDVISWHVSDSVDPFRLLTDRVARYGETARQPIPFTGGAVGYIGYDAGRTVESIPTIAARGLEIPDLLFGLYSWTIAWDHLDRRWAVVSRGLPETGKAAAAKAIEEARRIASILDRPLPSRRRPSPRDGEGITAGDLVLSSSVPRSRYLGMVEEAKRRIADGLFYQVNLSQRLELPAPADPVVFCEALGLHSPAPFSAFLDAGAFQVFSASPERFLSLRDRVVECRPIKGTRPRGATPSRDRALALELSASEKERAENVMIVDLVRNDLGRVCEKGSIETAAICRTESYASVHHLVSTVTGRLRDECDRADLLKALFPGGSMTGAPKVAAMRAIEELEPVRRGIYAGALGYLSFCGSIDLSIVIRTALVVGGRTWLQVGGGVVADSIPSAEHEESLHKAASVLGALRSTGVSWAPVPGTGTASRRSDR